MYLNKFQKPQTVKFILQRMDQNQRLSNPKWEAEKPHSNIKARSLSDLGKEL